MTRFVIWAVVVGAGCSGPAPGGGPKKDPTSDPGSTPTGDTETSSSGTESGGSGGADDSGSAPIDTGASALDGHWVGACPLSSVTTAPDFGDLVLTLDLTEVSGVASGPGELAYTQTTVFGGSTANPGSGTTITTPIALDVGAAGPFDGTMVDLEFRYQGKPLRGLELPATLAGDTLTGTLTWSPYGTWVETYDCALAR